MQRQKIRRYLLENFLFSTDESALGDSDSLIRSGILDSTGIHELVLFIEEEFDIAIAPEEMTPANFDSVAAVDGFISNKRAGEAVTSGAVPLAS
jgi:acyl carrier protein